MNTDRTTHMAWADQIDAERRTCTRGTTWAQLDAAIRAHCTHDAGALADPGTEALYDQALLATRPADLDAPAPVQTPARPATGAADPHAELGTPTQRALAIAAALSAWWLWGTAFPLP